MPRMFGKISLDGKQVTDFVPVKWRTELGTVTGHLTVPLHCSLDTSKRGYVLHLEGNRDIGISFSGKFGPRAYFCSDGLPGMR